MHASRPIINANTKEPTNTNVILMFIFLFILSFRIRLKIPLKINALLMSKIKLAKLLSTKVVQDQSEQSQLYFVRFNSLLVYFIPLWLDR